MNCKLANPYEVKRLELCVYQHLSLVGEISAMEEQVKYFGDSVAEC
jgi:hypothetical protein